MANLSVLLMSTSWWFIDNFEFGPLKNWDMVHTLKTKCGAATAFWFTFSEGKRFLWSVGLSVNDEKNQRSPSCIFLVAQPLVSHGKHIKSMI